MDTATIQRLNTLNRLFYERVADDFDTTRGKPWPGWRRLLPFVRPPLTVLDAGCGNGRFGRFLAGALAPGALHHYHGIDSSPALLARAEAALAGIETRLELADVLALPGEAGGAAGRYALVVAFGLLHHIPGAVTRRDLVRALAERVAPGGLLAFSCWRFYEEERFRARVVPWPDDLAGAVEPGDYLLDWRLGANALRYCHHVDDDEHAALVEASGLALEAVYRADGQSGRANLYTLLSRA